MDDNIRPEMAKEISCRVTRTLLMYVRDKNNGSLGNLLDELPLDEEYLSDTNNWVSHAFLQILYERMIDLLGDENAVYQMALASGRFQSLGILDRIVRLLGSPKLIYSQAPKYNRFLKLNGSVFIHEIGDSWVVLEDRYHDATQKTRFDCDYTRGILAGIPTMFDLPLAEVEEMKCQVDKEKYGNRIWPDEPDQGCEGCFYRVVWLPRNASFFKRFFLRRNYHRQAIEDLTQANQLIQSKFDEVQRLANDLETSNRRLVESKEALESQQAALIQSERKYRILADNVSDIIWVLNIETLKFDYISPSVEKTRGFTLEEAGALSLEQTLSPGSLADVSKILGEELARENEPGVDPQRSRTIEIEQSIKGGGFAWAEITVSFIRDQNGVPSAVMGVTRDVSERKKAEEERKELEIKLRNAKKLESLGTLAGGVAHDLNNILSGIVGYPDLLLMDIEENSPLREPLLTIQKSGERAAEIVQDLLTLTRRSVASKKVVSLNQIVKGFIASPEYGRIVGEHANLSLETMLSNGVLNILGSDTHLSKTLMNLVTNAIDAMPAGGEITISTRECYLDKPYKGFEIVPQGEFAVIEISDTGIGMPPSDLDRIFEPFFTKKELGRSGTGLGMSVVWGTVKDHDGFFDIITEEGTGTTFALYFPKSRAEMETPSSVHIQDYLGKGESILIIDDDPQQRDLAKRMMQRLGYEVETATSGETGVPLIEERRYDILILDMIMEPGMDGLETYRKILKIVPHQKAVIASGYAETERVKETQRLGAGRYIKKPFTLEKIGLAVRAELDTKR
ncbi:MAG: response regulator [Deltaproteobacteria bacterium]|nr:response regulator [Deltaproteobacteria bacterium]